MSTCFHCQSWRRSNAESKALCSAEERSKLGSPALALAVEEERLRLSWLHTHLFRQDEGGKARDPMVSLESFVWAHCLVRSRALELTAGLVRHSQNCNYWGMQQLPSYTAGIYLGLLVMLDRCECQMHLQRASMQSGFWCLCVILMGL